MTLLRKRTRWGDSVEIGSNMVPMQVKYTFFFLLRIRQGKAQELPSVTNDFFIAFCAVVVCNNDDDYIFVMFLALCNSVNYYKDI